MQNGAKSRNGASSHGNSGDKRSQFRSGSVVNELDNFEAISVSLLNLQFFCCSNLTSFLCVSSKKTVIINLTNLGLVVCRARQFRSDFRFPFKCVQVSYLAAAIWRVFFVCTKNCCNNNGNSSDKLSNLGRTVVTSSKKMRSYFRFLFKWMCSFIINCSHLTSFFVQKKLKPIWVF